ncbi:MAG: hypothetical protein K1W15_09695 [Lachnospiraceae bacterium]
MAQTGTEKRGVTIGTGSEGNTGQNVKEETFTSEETTNQLKITEEDFLQGLIDAACYADDENQTKVIEIIRPGKKKGEKRVMFRFSVKPLSEREYNKCKKKHTKYVRNRSLGVKMPEDTDNVKYRAEIIYRATVPEDRKKLWDNKEAWEALRDKGMQILSGLDMVEYCLLAGEKDRVIDVIDSISGYGDNLEEVTEGLENTIKN